MTQKEPRQAGSRDGPKKAVKNREDRLKSALKANLARRKAQARARAVDEADETDETGGVQGEQGEGQA